MTAQALPVAPVVGSRIVAVNGPSVWRGQVLAVVEHDLYENGEPEVYLLAALKGVRTGRPHVWGGHWWRGAELSEGVARSISFQGPTGWLEGEQPAWANEIIARADAQAASGDEEGL